MVETIGYNYYSIFIFIPNIQILPAVSTAGHGIINISSQWLKPLAMFCKPNYDPYFLKKYKTKKNATTKGCIFIQVTNQNKPFKK
jgi:hypothetical protein